MFTKVLTATHMALFTKVVPVVMKVKTIPRVNSLLPFAMQISFGSQVGRTELKYTSRNKLISATPKTDESVWNTDSIATIFKVSASKNKGECASGPIEKKRKKRRN